MAITEATIQKIALKVFNQQFAPTLRRSKLNLSSLNNDVGYTTAQDIKDHYLSIEWFNSLFQAVDSNKNPILPNDGDLTAVDSIKALLGFWTEEYISALGQGSGGGGGGGTLAGLYDVNLTNLQNGDVLVYDAATTHWINQQPSAAIDMTTVWNALAGNTNEQINASHLADALTGYVTSSGLSTILANYVTTSGLATTLADYVTTSALATTLADYVTTSALATALADYVTTTALATTLADYATKTYVDQNYLSLSFFNALFQARTSAGVAVAPNSGDTTTIDNIKAMFGFWTDQYLSALGQGSDGGAITSLAALTDVSLSLPLADGEVLTYSTTLGKWTNTTGGGGSVSWANVTNKPTTLAGYGITDAASTSDLANYLPLSGGTMTGNILVSADKGAKLGSSSARFYEGYIYRIYGVQSIESSFDASYRLTLPSKSGTIAVTSDLANYVTLNSAQTITATKTFSNYTFGNAICVHRNDTNATPAIKFSNQDGTLGYIGILNNDGYCWRWDGTASNRYKIWDEQNDGSGSGLDADLLDGQHGSYYAAASSLGNYLPLSGGTIDGTLTARNATYGESLVVYRNASGSNPSIKFRNTSSTWLRYLGFETGISDGSKSLYITTEDTTQKYYVITTTGGVLSDTLSVVKTAYGESELNVANDYNSVSLIASGNRGVYDRNNSLYLLGTNGSYTFLEVGNVGIGTRTPSHKLEVLGSGYFSYDNYKVLRVNRPSNSGAAIGYYTQNTLLGDIGINSSGSFLVRLTTNETTALTIDTSLNISAYGQYDSTISSSNQNYVRVTNSNGSVGIMTATARGLYDFTRSAWIIRFYSGSTLIPTSLDVEGNIVASGGVSALSDIRHKDILNDTTIKVEDIARMRSVAYRWNDGRKDNEIHVGSIAQDWQSVLPEVVVRENDAEGTLSLQYGVAALVSSITIAKKVVNHEQRITELEKECERLRRENELLKLKIA